MAKWNPFGRSVNSITRLWKADVGDHVNALALSPDGKVLAAAAVSGPIHVFDMASGKKLQELRGHGFGTCAVGWSASGTHFASAGQDGKVRLWDMATGSELLVLEGGAAWVERLAWCPTQDLLATAAGRKLRLWDATGVLVRQYADHASTIADIQWRPGEPVLASAAYGQLSLWRPEQDEPLQRFTWKGSMLALAWSPDAKYIATGDQDCTVHFWIMQSGEDLQMSGFPTKVNELSWDASGRYLATGGGAVPCIWDCSGKGPAGTSPIQFDAHTDRVSALAFQRKGPVLASAGLDGLLALWQPGKQLNALTMARLDAPITQILWSVDDRFLAAGTEAGQVAMYAVR